MDRAYNWKTSGFASQMGTVITAKGAPSIFKKQTPERFFVLELKKSNPGRQLKKKSLIRSLLLILARESSTVLLISHFILNFFTLSS